MTSATGPVGTSLAAQDWTNVFENTEIARTDNGSLLREQAGSSTLFESTRPGDRGPTQVEPLAGGHDVLQWDLGGRLEADDEYDYSWTGRGEWLGAKSRPGVDAPERQVRRDAFGRAVRSVHSGDRGDVVVDHVFIGPHVVEDRYTENGELCLVRTNHYDAGLDASVGHTIERFGPCAFALEVAGVADDAIPEGATRTYGHVRDLGRNVVAVVDEAGTVVERYAYAAHGESVDPTTGAPLSCGATCGSVVGTAVGYRSMRRLGYGDAYDARFRIYDTRLRQFWSPDPMGWVDGYDRWMYVGGDAVNGWDPWGLWDVDDVDSVDPQQLQDHAIILDAAGAAYDGATLPSGSPLRPLADFELIDLGLDPQYFSSGDFAAVAFDYQSDDGDWVLAIGIAGTTNEFGDILTDIFNAISAYNLNPFGFGSIGIPTLNFDVLGNHLLGQYDKAAALGAHVGHANLPYDRIVFTGHSLGGGLAVIAALVADAVAVTANAAGVGPDAIRTALGEPRARLGGGGRLSGAQRDRVEATVTSYFVPDEILRFVQRHPLLPSAAGRGVRLSDGPWGNMLERHRWGPFRQALTESLRSHAPAGPAAGEGCE